MTWNTSFLTFIAQWGALYFRFASQWNTITTLACWSWAQHSVAGGFPPQTFGTVCISIAWHKIFWVPRWIWNQIWNYQNSQIIFSPFRYGGRLQDSGWQIFENWRTAHLKWQTDTHTCLYNINALFENFSLYHKRHKYWWGRTHVGFLDRI
jgi:hypothetical protein